MLETPEKSSQPTRLRNLNMALSIKDVKRTARMLRKQDLNRSDLGSDPLETLRSGSDLQMEVSKKDPKGDVKSVQRPVDLPEKSLLLLMMLSAMVGIEGRYISLKRGSGTNAGFYFQVDSSMDLALQELAMRVFPLCESFLLIDEFVESRYQFKKGLVKHAFAAALRALLLAKMMTTRNEARRRASYGKAQGVEGRARQDKDKARQGTSMGALVLLLDKAAVVVLWAAVAVLQTAEQSNFRPSSDQTRPPTGKWLLTVARRGFLL